VLSGAGACCRKQQSASCRIVRCVPQREEVPRLVVPSAAVLLIDGVADLFLIDIALRL